MKRSAQLKTVVVLLSVTLTTLGGVASAQETDDAQNPPETISRFSTAELGAGDALVLPGVSARSRVSFPVPPGTVPQTWSGMLTVPAGVTRGWITVSSENRPVARIDVPPDVSTAPFSIPLGAARVADGAIVLDIASTLTTEDGLCLPPRDTERLALWNAGVDYRGTPALPTAIADFLPPVLRTATIYLPSDPTREQSAAAMDLATSLVHYYGSRPVRVVLRPGEEFTGTADGPFDRSVVITSGTDPALELIVPTTQNPPALFVSGGGTALIDQTRVVTSSIADLAVVRSATSGPARTAPTLVQNEMSLDALNVGTVSATGSGSASVTIPVDQSDIGRALSTMRMHLIGSRTPAPDGSGAAVTVSAGGTVLDQFDAGRDGTIDRWVSVPGTVMGRTTPIEVTATDGGRAAQCGEGGSTEITVDGTSVVAGNADGAPSPNGFESLPQALMPTVDVGIDRTTFQDTVRATSILTGLQRLTTAPFRIRTVSVDEALAGTGSAVVVAPDGAAVDDVAMPLTADAVTTLSVTSPDSDAASTLTVPEDTTFASLQVVRDDGRTLLVASSRNAPDQLDRTLVWLGEDPARWQNLRGDIVFTVDGRDPVVLSSAAVTAAGPPGGEQPESSVSRAEVLALAVGAAMLVAGFAAAAWAVVRGRRLRSRSDSR